jgi:Ice-binding-like
MKTNHVILSAITAFALWQPLAFAQTIVPLGSASNFAVLGGSAITFTGTAQLTGDYGSYPTGAIAGASNVTFVTGSNQTANTGLMSAAKNDLATAYGLAAGQAATVGKTSFTNGGILAPGVYAISSTTTDITGNITLNGSSSDIFVFKMSSTLITADSSHILLSGGAQASNVFWQVATSATLGGSTIFEGNVLANTSIGLGSGSTVDGRLLAMTGAVTLDGNNTISAPTAVPEPATTSLLIAGFSGLFIGIQRIRRRFSVEKSKAA